MTVYKCIHDKLLTIAEFHNNSHTNRKRVVYCMFDYTTQCHTGYTCTPFPIYDIRACTVPQQHPCIVIASQVLILTLSSPGNKR